MPKHIAPPQISDTVLDTGTQQIARVYSKALVGAAEKAGQTEAVLAELDTVVTELLDRFPKLEQLFSSILVSSEEKVAILDRILAGRASPLVLNFLKVLSGHGRLHALRAIRTEARRLYDEMRGRQQVQVATAAALNGALADRLRNQLRHMLGGEPTLVHVVDPELIGGLVLRVGDTVYDGSVATRLARVRGQMITRSVHEIQRRRDRFSHPAGN